LSKGGVLTPPVIAALLEMAKHRRPGNPSFRAVAALARGCAADERAVSEIFASMSPYTFLSRVFIRELVRTGVLTEPVVAVLHDVISQAHPGMASDILSEVVEEGILTPSTAALLTLLVHDDRPEISIAAAETLAAAGPLGPRELAAVTALACGSGAPDIRVQAAAVLADAGSLSEPVVAALEKILRRCTDPSVDEEDLSLGVVDVLARAATSDSVVGILSEVARSAEPPFLRVSAIGALAGHRAWTDSLIADAVAMVVDRREEPSVRVEAAQALASLGPLAAPVVVALSDVAVATSDMSVRVAAVSLVADAGLMSPPLAEVLKEVAELSRLDAGATAMELLAQHHVVDETMMAFATDLARNHKGFLTREAAILMLRAAPPTEELQDLLLAIMRNDLDNDVRRAAGVTLADVARRHPSAGERIKRRLAAACADPAFNFLDTYEQRPAWDYAQDSLWTTAEAVSPRG
ncbi:MAG: hypothetical protein ABW022_23245, partial [Actinoplanes sp.]